MLKNQRQNLVMENEFHIKEERVKAQQSSGTVKKEPISSTSVKKEPISSAPVKKEPISSASVKKEPISSASGKKESSSASGKKESSSSSVGKKDGVTVKKEPVSSTSTAVSGRKDGSSAGVEIPGKKNGEKGSKERNLGKGKTTVREEVTTAQHPCWDVAPSDPSSTPQPVSGTTTPSSTASATAGGKQGSTHNGPASSASPKTGQRRQMPAESPDPVAEKGKQGPSSLFAVTPPLLDAKRRKLEESKVCDSPHLPAWRLIAACHDMEKGTLHHFTHS